MKISEIKSTLERLGASPRKSLGQNFLHDGNLANWLVQQLHLNPGESVLEIGPGLGALTECLPLDRVSATLIEKDRLFAPFLRERFARPNVEVVEGDALDYNPKQLFCRGEVKLIGNLPYYLSSALLFHFSAEPCPFSRMVLTVQKEVGDRLTALPRSGEYGAITVLLQQRWRVRRLKILPPSVFLPRPDVDSVAVELDRLLPADVAEINADWLTRLVKTGFSERRKKLSNTLGKLVPAQAVAAALEAEGFGPLSRAEEISPTGWANLAKRLSPQQAGIPTRPVAGDAETQERLQVVDGQDRPIGGLPRWKVHADKLLHRAVHIFVLNGRGELFLQRRSRRKDNFPRKWDSSAAGHVDEGESYEQCAGRELYEELGLNSPLKEIAKVPASALTGWEFIRIYFAQADEVPDFNETEIETCGFFGLSQVDDWIQKRPEDFATGFLECYQMVRGELGIGG
ncbi:MAG: ribosomal RNA small subunit methyltransferase A [Verrucomicrobia bacterium]|nr:ribosomal RNA small subunit methyltransferase A [Verrucomicrobiota bacterium]